MSTRPTDEQITAWALAARAGDRAAAGMFIRATQSDVIRFLAHVSDPTSVEDLAQETFLRAMRALPRFAARSSARTWLLAIARRAAADHIRELTRRPRVAAVADWVSAADNARASASPRFEERHALRAIIDTLDPRRREAFVLTQVVGLSYAEAAQIIRCPIGTVRSRVARAREDLIAALGESGRAQHLRAV